MRFDRSIVGIHRGHSALFSGRANVSWRVVCLCVPLDLSLPRWTDRPVARPTYACAMIEVKVYAYYTLIRPQRSFPSDKRSNQPLYKRQESYLFLRRMQLVRTAFVLGLAASAAGQCAGATGLGLACGALTAVCIVFIHRAAQPKLKEWRPVRVHWERMLHGPGGQAHRDGVPAEGHGGGDSGEQEYVSACRTIHLVC